ncbi:MAG: chemotaxis protein CheA [Pseudomonadota bacterium]|nr:chemotaxis protein CheA [Pseudomonadota bacterium]
METKPAIQPNNIRIDSDRVENILDLVGELVVIKSQVLNQCANYATDTRLNSIAAQLDKTIRELQDKTLSMRLTPLKNLFLKTQRVVRDLSVKLDKPVEFHMLGEDTEIDRRMVDLLGDPLLHIVRNCLDHGVEETVARKKKGKNASGHIHLHAKQLGDRIQISITDDGAGIDRNVVIQKGQEKGLISATQDVEKLTDQQVYSLLFEVGFSTASAVTDVSGRGVGMDVVKSNVEKMKGDIEIDSKPGVGTKIILTLPLTTSITDGMITQAGNHLYIIPMECILELIHVTDADFLTLENGTKAINHREQVYPILDLEDIFSKENPFNVENLAKSEQKMYVLVESGKKRLLVGVNFVIGQTQVVLKLLGDSFRQIKGISGASILGDGKIALVINPLGLENLLDDPSLRNQ